MILLNLLLVPLFIPCITNLSYLLMVHLCIFFARPDHLSLASLDHLVHYGGHSHFIFRNILISYYLQYDQTSTSAYYLYNIYVLSMRVFDKSTLCLIQQSQSNDHSIELIFESMIPFLSHKISEVNLYFIHDIPIRCVISSSMSHFS